MKELFRVAIATRDLIEYLAFSNAAFKHAQRSKELPQEILEDFCVRERGNHGFRTLNGQDVILYPIENIEWFPHQYFNLMIAASTPSAECFVNDLKGTGLIIGRYSRFYSGKSEYTGRTAEQGGYSLDLPKDPNTAFQLLTNDGVIQALTHRSECEIIGAIEDLNPRIERKLPLIVTPYLGTALAIKGAKT